MSETDEDELYQVYQLLFSLGRIDLVDILKRHEKKKSNYL